MSVNAKFLLTAAIIVATPALVAQKYPGEDPVSGTWTGWVGRSEANPSSAKFELRMAAGGAFTGKVFGAQIAPGEITNGKYDANTGVIKFTAFIRAADGSNKGGDVLIEGRVFDDSLVGGMKLGEDMGLVRLSRVPPGPGVAKEKVEDPALVAARRGFVEVSDWITRAAEMVPAEKYAYRPVGTVRTFGEVVAHVADGARFYCANGSGKKTEWSDATEKGASGKATIVAALKKSFADCGAAYQSGKNIAPLMENVGHSSLHYGNIVTYLRMMGLKPPSSG
jgi:uncharacterized damage-inducible protein DinB